MGATGGAAVAQYELLRRQLRVRQGRDLGGIKRRGRTLPDPRGGRRRHEQGLACISQHHPDPNCPEVNARDRIGKGPWQNFKGEVIAQNVDDLHGPGNKLNGQTALTERGAMIAGFGMTPNYHDAITGSTPDGHAFASNLNLTCNNYTSSSFGKAMLGHIDRRGPADTDQMRSWNASHQSRDCSQEGLIATGGNGLFYCFAR